MTDRTDPQGLDSLDAYVDDGGDVSEFFRTGEVVKPNQLKRVNVDFNERQLAELDAEAAYLSIPRQAVIKTLLDEALTRRRAARRGAAA